MKERDVTTKMSKITNWIDDTKRYPPANPFTPAISDNESESDRNLRRTDLGDTKEVHRNPKRDRDKDRDGSTGSSDLMRNVTMTEDWDGSVASSELHHVTLTEDGNTSPEATAAYTQKITKIADWVDETKRHPLVNPFSGDYDKYAPINQFTPDTADNETNERPHRWNDTKGRYRDNERDRSTDSGESLRSSIEMVQYRYQDEFSKSRQQIVHTVPLLYANTEPSNVPAASGSNVIISKELPSASYVSARLSTVQMLEKRKCLLVVQFQCHPSENRRFASLRINWRIRGVHGAQVPKVLDFAPKQSIGARNEEHRTQQTGISMNGQFAGFGGTVGPQLNQSWEINKTVPRAIIITGSIRGILSDAAEWTVKENSSTMSGIPPHLRVALVVEYGGIFVMELDVVAKQLAASSRWWSSKHDAKGSLYVDVDRLVGEFEPYGASQNWRQWFSQITGEVDGAVAELNYEGFRA